MEAGGASVHAPPPLAVAWSHAPPVNSERAADLLISPPSCRRWPSVTCRTKEKHKQTHQGSTNNSKSISNFLDLFSASSQNQQIRSSSSPVVLLLSSPLAGGSSSDDLKKKQQTRKKKNAQTTHKSNWVFSSGLFFLISVCSDCSRSGASFVRWPELQRQVKIVGGHGWQR